MEMNNLMIDKLNAQKELYGKIAEMLMPMHPEAADLKAHEIIKLIYLTFLFQQINFPKRKQVNRKLIRVGKFKNKIK